MHMITIIRPEPPGKSDWVSSERWYLTDAGEVVGAEDPRKSTLLIAAGGRMPLAEAEMYGLVGRATDPAVIDADVQPVDSVASATPSHPAKSRHKKRRSKQ